MTEDCQCTNLLRLMQYQRRIAFAYRKRKVSDKDIEKVTLDFVLKYRDKLREYFCTSSCNKSNCGLYREK